MRIPDWHSVSSPVYHNNDKCHIGNNIELVNRRLYIHRNKRLCSECEKLNKIYRCGIYAYMSKMEYSR